MKLSDGLFRFLQYIKLTSPIAASLPNLRFVADVSGALFHTSRPNQIELFMKILLKFVRKCQSRAGFQILGMSSMIRLLPMSKYAVTWAITSNSVSYSSWWIRASCFREEIVIPYAARIVQSFSSDVGYNFVCPVATSRSSKCGFPLRGRGWLAEGS